MAVGHKVTMVIERYTETITGTGSPSFVWRPLRNLKGTLNAISGNEAILYNKETVTVTNKFIISYPAGITITERDRLRIGLRYFDIHHVQDPHETRRILTIYLLERKDL